MLMFTAPIEEVDTPVAEQKRPVRTFERRKEWSPERIEALRELWKQRELSAQVIADMLGCVSRSAVLGKVHRLGLEERPHAPAKKRVYVPRPRVVKPKTPKPVREPKPLPAPYVVPVEAPTFLCIPVEALQEHHCRFPLGDPQSEDFGFCGLDRPFGATYCAWHHGIAFVKHSKVKANRADTERRIREMSRKGALKRWAA
jgi:GcrA cell cycle regulator